MPAMTNRTTREAWGNDREASEVRIQHLAYLYATFRKLRQTYDANPYANLIYMPTYADLRLFLLRKHDRKRTQQHHSH